MFEKFPSIEQYRQTIKAIKDRHQYVGKDADGNVIFDRNKPLPIVSFLQTIKIHGTNGGVILLRDGTIRTQSRNRLLSPDSDNNGFDKWISERKDYWQTVSKTLYQKYDTASKIVAYGEFAGENIQRNVAVSKTPKSFYVFYVKVIFDDGSHVDLDMADFDLFIKNELNIYSIYQFPSPVLQFDLNQADVYIPILQDITMSVEQQCPVGEFHGVHGIGEGIVMTTCYDNEVYRFKVKGEKHSASKVKLLPDVDGVMIASVREFVDQTLTENRLEQGVAYMEEMRIPTDIKHIGDYLRWVVGDVNKEERDIIEAKGLKPSLVNKEIANKAKHYYFDRFGV